MRLQYSPPAGRMGALIARLFGEEPSQQIQEDLHRVKQCLETGDGRGDGHEQPADAGNQPPGKDPGQSLERRLLASGAESTEARVRRRPRRRVGGHTARRESVVMVMETARDTIKDVSGIVKGVARHAARDARDAARDRVNAARDARQRERHSPRAAVGVESRRLPPGVVTGASLALLAAGSGAAARRRRQSFEGQTVLITGASRGLGLVLARRFAAEGAHVAILARGGAALAEAAQELRANGADIDAFEADISNRAEAERAVHRLISRWGRIDVLINNAGQILSAPQQHVTVEDFERSMGVHFYGPLHLIRAAVPHMRRQGGGRIVNIASIGGKVAVPHLLPYCASKFALVGLSDGLRAELARDRIAVTTIIPGLMRTGSHLNARFRGHHQARVRVVRAGGCAAADVDGRRARRVEDHRSHARASGPG